MMYFVSIMGWEEPRYFGYRVTAIDVIDVLKFLVFTEKFCN